MLLFKLSVCGSLQVPRQINYLMGWDLLPAYIKEYKEYKCAARPYSQISKQGIEGGVVTIYKYWVFQFSAYSGKVGKVDSGTFPLIFSLVSLLTSQ